MPPPRSKICYKTIDLQDAAPHILPCLIATMPDEISKLLLVQNQWIRDPNGSSLPRPPPSGNRTPNGLIWGHTMNDFYWIQRRPGTNVFAIWSRSMIQEFGENFTGTYHEYEPTPRVLRPWPVLQLPPGISSDPPLGLVDETCFCNHIRDPLPVSHYDDEGNLRPRHEGEWRSVRGKLHSGLRLRLT